MKTILVTGVGGDISQGVIKCLRDCPGRYDRLIGCDTDKYAAGRKLVDRFYVAPAASAEKEYLDLISTLIAQEEASQIFPVSDPEILFFNRHRKDFEGTTVFINNEATINTFTDKFKTVSSLGALGLDVPRTCLPSQYDGALGYPILFKLRRGWGGRGLRVINNQDEFALYRETINDDYIIQEIVGTPDEEYTVGVFSDGQKTRSISFRRRLSGEWGGFSKQVVLVHDENIDKLAKVVAGACNLKGAINIQLRKVGGRYVIFEINPRISSTVYFRHFFGFRDVEWWLDLVEGKRTTYTPLYRMGVGVKTYGEVFLDLG